VELRDPAAERSGTSAALTSDMIQTLSLETLASVTGGASKSSELTSSLSAIQSSIGDLKNNNKQSDSSSLLLPIMMMSMNRKQQGAVVATPGATVVTG
jgi:hypothetical protein